MAKTKIEWCDYTINPVKGLCPRCKVVKPTQEAKGIQG